MVIGDFLSPKKSIIQAATTTGYIKLIVEATPLEMLAKPISSVMAVIERRALRRTIFQNSSAEAILRDLFLYIAKAKSPIAAVSQR